MRSLGVTLALFGLVIALLAVILEVRGLRDLTPDAGPLAVWVLAFFVTLAGLLYEYTSERPGGVPAETSQAGPPLGAIVVCLKCGAKNVRTDVLCRNCETNLDEAKRALVERPS